MVRFTNSRIFSKMHGDWIFVILTFLHALAGEVRLCMMLRADGFLPQYHSNASHLTAEVILYMTI